MGWNEVIRLAPAAGAIDPTDTFRASPGGERHRTAELPGISNLETVWSADEASASLSDVPLLNELRFLGRAAPARHYWSPMAFRLGRLVGLDV